MCGIAVAVGWPEAEKAVRALLAAMSHRGDVSDPIVSPRPGVAMATRRLRIVDFDGGQQPKLSANGRILVSFNGEIYNHVELRRELEMLGLAFRSDSDTEVLANALSVWGPAALQRLEGMYAFVAYDAGAGEFLAARDPFGVKPLYLIERGGGYLFASEIRPLLQASEVGNVLLLPPGHWFTRRALQPFARPHAPPIAGVETLDKLMRTAVHSRVPPDLPFALLFSGGIDSTLVAHYARELEPKAPGYFLGDELAPDFEFAARYADAAKLDLRVTPITSPRNLTRAHLAEVIATIETFEPSVVRDAMCNYALFERIHSDGLRVALSGEGADELFAGYVPLEIAFAHGREAGDYVRRQTLANMSRTNLQRLDRCAMRFQIEAREPLLDSRLAAYALSLGGDALINEASAGFAGKRPLRELFDLYPGALPEAIRRRRKIALHVGSGLDKSQNVSPWIDFANGAVGDAEFAEARRQFALYPPASKEEALYLTLLSERMDLSRVPHLAARPLLKFPAVKLGKEAFASLAEYLAAA
jgi:asparagine synthase (glutamine-hydrolysing)